MDFIKRKYTTGEEIFNSVSHGTGALLAIAGAVVLIVLCAVRSGAAEVVSASIYGFSLIILYTMSTLYHAITNEKAKKFFRVMDYNTIFLLIAGTYTPFTLAIIKGALGWTMFGVIWGATVVGIVLSSVNLKKFKKVSTVCYTAMGWVIVFAIKPLIEKLPLVSLILLFAGGLCYTVGIIFFIMKEHKYMHSIWHLFVIAGSVLHYFSIFTALVK